MTLGEFSTVNRRDFIRWSGFGLAVTGQGLSAVAMARPAPEGGLNPYVVIHEDGRVLISAPNPDVGQGVNTSLPMIVAEELDADWASVEVIAAPVDPQRYGAQFAGGSLSVRNRWNELRTMGATAREMLLRAAAASWQLPREQLTTEPGQVVHGATGRRASYGELAALAAQQPVPGEGEVTLKDSAEYRLLGSRVVNAAAEDIVRGHSLFGIDVVVPDMVYATYVKCPQPGGTPSSANLDAVKNLPGVLDAFLIKGDSVPPVFDLRNSTHVAGGVAIVATNTWAAFKARRSLQVQWDTAGASRDDSATIESQAVKAMEQVQGDRE
ncbi:MAG: molybdopterin cofactor-binding domain-containing protein, partial [Luminiphilus sp.]